MDVEFMDTGAIWSIKPEDEPCIMWVSERAPFDLAYERRMLNQFKMDYTVPPLNQGFTQQIQGLEK